MKFDGADIYPVGVLSTIKTVWRCATVPGFPSGQRRVHAKRAVLSEWRYLRTQIKARNWRAVRNSFNGYLAEHDGHPHNCGKGWTKRAAKRRVEALCAEQVSEVIDLSFGRQS